MHLPLLMSAVGTQSLMVLSHALHYTPLWQLSLSSELMRGCHVAG